MNFILDKILNTLQKIQYAGPTVSFIGCHFFQSESSSHLAELRSHRTQILQC
jgi:hypothetical protein